eukprot:CAMPEP_0176362518 /NCGR_PEP_ID=MMETSP0126-20121128/18486_1 /TAXON_ID=141414 ORGANISM="Strombidinopsis acuminatum, Strain SPMC142" /NCGR_SAMPLE_ID=MMETSP0126 /ASSEMBLY_ACC=CAM_ASM_000229 /LENGTH=77 /DNA_ID=CAMNT_0017718471 /DNA_START=388 /DNA_END=621 /DNA_ORIENTATION=-
MFRNADPKCNIFVKGFKNNWTHQTLYENFKEFGEVLSCKVSIDAEHISRGYGFVQFKDLTSASEAIKKMDGKELPDD